MYIAVYKKARASAGIFIILLVSLQVFSWGLVTSYGLADVTLNCCNRAIADFAVVLFILPEEKSSGKMKHPRLLIDGASKVALELG